MTHCFIIKLCIANSWNNNNITRLKSVDNQYVATVKKKHFVFILFCYHSFSTRLNPHNLLSFILIRCIGSA